MITLDDLVSGDTMAGEAGQAAPQILLGANEIANGYLARESAQNKLMMDDLKLMSELKNAPFNDMITKATAIQKLNLDTSEIESKAAEEAFSEVFGGKKPTEKELMQNWNQLQSLTDQKVKEYNDKLAPLDLNNPSAYVQSRLDVGDLKPDFQIDIEKAQTAAATREKLAEQRMEHQLKIMLANQGFDMDKLIANFNNQAERDRNKATKDLQMQQNMFNQQQSRDDQKRAEDEKKRKEQRAEDAAEAAQKVKANPAMMPAKRAKIVADYYEETLANGSQTQIEAFWEKHKDVLLPQSYDPPFGPKFNVPGKPRQSVKDKQTKSFKPDAKFKTAYEWAKKNPNNPYSKVWMQNNADKVQQIGE